MRLTLCALSLLTLLIMLSWSQPSNPLTLDEAIQLALRNNRAVQISERNLEKSRNAVREARGNALPQLQGNATYTRFDRVATARFGPQPIRLGNIENRTARITLTQVIDISGIVSTAIR
ncbi:MAG: TolC family protein, partial [Fimbriimonadales bacterium]|nr:TolC family protein [Fimbriimonadales bacterium]